MRSALSRSVLIVAGLSLSLVACTGGSSNLDDLAETLRDVAELTEEESVCVATEIRANTAYTDDIVNDLADGVAESDEAKPLLEPFEQDVATAVTKCLQPS